MVTVSAASWEMGCLAAISGRCWICGLVCLLWCDFLGLRTLVTVVVRPAQLFGIVKHVAFFLSLPPRILVTSLSLSCALLIRLHHFTVPIQVHITISLLGVLAPVLDLDELMR